MRVGIYTHYSHCDQAYFAVRLADFLRKQNVDFSIYSDNEPARLKLPYDRSVLSKKIVRYTDWIKKQTAVVWTHVPRIEQIKIAEKNNTQTLLVPMWQDLVKPFKKTMAAADGVVALNTEAAGLYQDIYKIRHTSLIPFDTGLPITKKNGRVNDRKVRLFLPWFDRNARCTNGDFLSVLAYLIEKMPDACLTVGITPSQFSPAIVKFFTGLEAKTSGRVTVVRATAITARPALYIEQDLTIWPGECDNYGICPLTSLTMGTPVLSVAVSPQTDFLIPETNAVLVKTRSDYDEYGVVHAVPDYAKFGVVLQELIAEPKYIDEITAKTPYNLSIRRRAFESGWAEILQIR